MVQYVNENTQHTPDELDPVIGGGAGGKKLSEILPSSAQLSALQSSLSQMVYNVKQNGAIGDGITNDWKALQQAIDNAFNNGYGIVYLPAGTYRINDNTLILWGSNLKLIGAGKGKTIIKKFGSPGYNGDCCDITGLVNGLQYYGNFGAGDYSVRTAYTGATQQSKNLVIEGITFETDLSVTGAANNFGVGNCDNVIVRDCEFKNAPQTNIACVNSGGDESGSIYFEHCISTGSKKHGTRINSYGTGNSIKVHFSKCQFLNSAGVDTTENEILNRQVHLWVRAGVDTENFSVKVYECYFDSTGSIVGTNNIKNVDLQNNRIENGVYFAGQVAIESNLKVINNKFTGVGAKTNFTTEAYIHFENINHMVFEKNDLPKTPNISNTNRTMNLSSVINGHFSKNKNMSVNMGSVVQPNSDLVFIDNYFNPNTKQTDERNILIAGHNITLAENFMNLSMVMIGGSTNKNLKVVNNRFYLNSNEGYSVVDGYGTLETATILGNYCEGGASFPTNRVFCSLLAGNIVNHNTIKHNNGTITGETTWGTAPPTTGTFLAGNRRFNSSPAVGSPKSWLCTVTGAPGTWVSEGNL